MDNKRQKVQHSAFSVRRKFWVYLILIVGAFISLVPFVWMISTSLKSLGEALGSTFFPVRTSF